jgi:DNA-binding response OmpR family regulator
VSEAAQRAVLLVEDEARVADFLHRGLRAEGYALTIARDGEEGLALALTGDFAVIVLDLMLPRLSGLDVCQRLRAAGRLTPVLMLTAIDAVEKRVEGLRRGADDYLGKPFAFDELLARIEALIRRDRRFAVGERRLAVGDLAFDRDALRVERGGRAVELTAKELALLDFLMGQPGRVVSRARILSNVWGVAEDPLTNVVDVFVRRLRKKLHDPEGRLIRTVRGYGYKIEAESGSSADSS